MACPLLALVARQADLDVGMPRVRADGHVRDIHDGQPRDRTAQNR